MIVADSSKLDPLRRYALDHFMTKFGIQAGAEGVCLGYAGDFPTNHPAVKLSKNEMGDGLEGAIHYGREVFPLFEVPIKIDAKGKTIATFSSGVDEYPVIVESETGIEIGFDVLNEAGHLLSGFLERYWPAKTAEARYIARTPTVDIYEKILMDCIESVARRRGIKVARKDFWPDGRKFALGLSHDVDLYRKTVQYFSHFIRHLEDYEFKEAAKQVQKFFMGMGKNPYWNFEEMKKIEEQLKVKSSIYFLNQKASASQWNLQARLLQSGACRFDVPAIRKTIKQFSDSGWDVGLHQSIESYKNEPLLRVEKGELDAITQKSATGVRQHYLKVDIPDIWLAQEAAGFDYDSSMGFTTTIGFRSATCFPFRVFDSRNDAPLRLIEIPLAIMEREVLTKDKDPWELCMEILETVEKYGGVATILWHQRFFNEDEFPGYAKLYEKIIGYCQERGAWVTSLSDVHEWWAGR